MREHTQLTCENGCHTLGVKTLNITKTNAIERGVGYVLLEYQFKNAIKKYFKNVKFDIVMYSTPPITFNGVVKDVRKHSPLSMTYLLLKDIFPQNAVDLGLMQTTGLKGLLYKYFRRKEKELYRISDYIGCMSPANVRYILSHNPEIPKERVEVAPNSLDVPNPLREVHIDKSILSKYGLPVDRPVFIYGGNMGKPQGIPFLIECMKAVQNRDDCHFVLVGDGTEYPKLEKFVNECKPKAVSVIRRLPKEDYEMLAGACDVGLIFLDYRFSIPNYPSRLLSYLMEHKPVIAVTDPNCDTGMIAEANGYGFRCLSNSVDSFVAAVNKILVSDIKEMGESAYRYFLANYTTNHTYGVIVSHLK